ncbi:flagellar protein FliT [Parachitinimonas caeni]|uniref:Flagellar protein FliT n=1 Tax=Parachitinimonas caeni TaxID=3031301 RepID=A0ABT7E4W7_9NEIS|nr:flagellar protein FliT [Parachitinimonas caeni]MDK2126413.1 flagellar protein FliT [Parachitinimonas caeni]
MAASEFSTTLAHHQQLLEATLSLLGVAREERWDDIEAAGVLQREALARIESQPAEPLSAEQRGQLNGLLQQIDHANQEALQRVEAWRLEVGDILQSFEQSRGNADRLSKAYGG